MDHPAATSASLGPDREAQLQALATVFGADYAKGFDDPVVFITRVFQSPAVKQFFKREFPLISRTLFVESVYRRRPMYNQTVLDDFASISKKKLADILALLGTQCDRIRKVCESNAALTDAQYMHPQTTLIPIIAGEARTYIEVLTKLDEAYQLCGSAILNGVIDGNQRKSTELLCRKAVRAFSAMQRNEIIKLRKESQRLRAGLTVPDVELDKAEGAQTESIRDFDEHTHNEAQLDASGSVAPDAAAQLLDDMVATTVATTAKRRKVASEAPPVAPAMADSAP